MPKRMIVEVFKAQIIVNDPAAVHHYARLDICPVFPDAEHMDFSATFSFLRYKLALGIFIQMRVVFRIERFCFFLPFDYFFQFGQHISIQFNNSEGIVFRIGKRPMFVEPLNLLVNGQSAIFQINIPLAV